MTIAKNKSAYSSIDPRFCFPFNSHSIKASLIFLEQGSLISTDGPKFLSNLSSRNIYLPTPRKSTCGFCSSKDNVLTPIALWLQQ